MARFARQPPEGRTPSGVTEFPRVGVNAPKIHISRLGPMEIAICAGLLAAAPFIAMVVRGVRG